MCVCVCVSVCLSLRHHVGRVLKRWPHPRPRPHDVNKKQSLGLSCISINVIKTKVASRKHKELVNSDNVMH